tara:strand:- start:335 stop:544 length:210 start_codon:yes stop_codon:yes gene_type:complete
MNLEEYMQTLAKGIVVRVRWLDMAIAIEPDIPKVSKELEELQEKFNAEINNVLEISDFRKELLKGRASK